MSFDYRKLLPNGSQFTARFFAGKFLKYNQQESTFFDFNLNRPQDYLFRYNYFGRSEEKGFFSQQIVMAEGGFKSLLLPATANDYLLTTNLTVGIWKWIEAYLDLGVLRNHKRILFSFMAPGFGLMSFRIIWKYFSPFIVITVGNSARCPTKTKYVLYLLLARSS